MKNLDKVLFALATGMVTGAVLGVLLAPHKGSKTRRLIKAEGEKVLDDLCQKFGDGMTKLNELKDEIIQTPKDATSKRKEAE